MNKIIGNRLRTAREAAGLTQSEVADLLGIKRNSYTHIETGRNSLTVEHLVKLQDILGRSAVYILGSGTPDLNSDEAELLELYRALPADYQRLQLGFLRTAVEQVQKSEKGE